MKTRLIWQPVVLQYTHNTSHSLKNDHSHSHIQQLPHVRSSNVTNTQASSKELSDSSDSLTSAAPLQSKKRSHDLHLFAKLSSSSYTSGFDLLIRYCEVPSTLCQQCLP